MLHLPVPDAGHREYTAPLVGSSDALAIATLAKRARPLLVAALVALFIAVQTPPAALLVYGTRDQPRGCGPPNEGCTKLARALRSERTRCKTAESRS